MFKGYFLDVLVDLIKELEKKPDIKETEDRKGLSFSTDIQDVQDFCFREGINGNCNENCIKFNGEDCELKEEIC